MTRLYARGGRSRAEFLARTGHLKEVDPLVDLAYKLLNEREFAKSDQGEAARHKWHVSFHGSQFPGDVEYACGRANLYRLLDVPRTPFTRRGRQFMDAGKDFEDRLVWAWYDAGFLVSNPPIMPDGSREQTMFEDPDSWLTSTVDAILLKPRSNKPFVAEVKQVGARYIEALKNLTGTPVGHEKYLRQLKCQIGMAHEYGPITVVRCHNTGALAKKDGNCAMHGHANCLEEQTLEVIDDGFLYYTSRDEHMDTFEFYREYDEHFMRAGKRKLMQWREDFINDTLPQTNFEDKRFSHPFGWRWTLDEYPCKWCEYGDICRDDHDVAKERGAPISLRESAAVEVAERFRADWSYDEVKNAVLERWGLVPHASEAVAA